MQSTRENKYGIGPVFYGSAYCMFELIKSNHYDENRTKIYTN